MKHILLLWCYLFVSIAALASGVKGKITGINEDGVEEVLAFASIYVEQTNSGTSSNTEGIYKIDLPPGIYDIHFQYLGYESTKRRIQIGESYLELNIQLKPTSYQLQEARVDGGREDPALTVMRKAISKASYHRQQLDGYTAQVYVKGSGRLLDVPFFLRKKVREEGLDSNMAFNSESIMDVEYQRPNTYRQKVISMRSSGKMNENSPINFVFGSFYAEEINSAVSPLSPHAFSFYRFKLVNTFVEGKHSINKILVSPRARGENVFYGHIYIVEDDWSIHSLNLNIESSGIITNLQQIYVEIQKAVWLPINHKFQITGSIFGVEFLFDYLATVSNYSIELNEELGSFELIDEKLEPDFSESISKKDIKTGEVDVTKLEGQKIDRKSLNKLMQEYEKQMYEERKEEGQEDVAYIYDTEIDSTAKKKDSAYWQSVRPVPLTEYEKKANIVLDSIRMEEQKKKEKDSLKNREGFRPTDLIFGKTYQLNDKNKLVLQVPFDQGLYNTVDGFFWGYKISYENKLSENSTFVLAPEGKYNFARESVNAQMQFSYLYKDKLLNSFEMKLSAGRMERQHNSDNPIHPLVNLFTTFFLERNYIRLYERDFLQMNVKRGFKEKLIFDFEVAYAERWSLENHSDFKLIDYQDRNYMSNIPQSFELSSPYFSNHFAFNSSLSINYSPWLKYRIINDKRKALASSSPTFNLRYVNGLQLMHSKLSYHRLELGIKNTFDLPAGRSMNLELNAGKFLRKKKLYFPDYKHFMGNESPIVAAGPVGNFRLLEYYYFSTEDTYASAHYHYHFRRLLFTRLLPLRMLGLKENLFVNYLHSPSSDNYMELGYGLDNIFRFFRIEGIASFQNFESRHFGLRIGISTSFFNEP